jgi:hypothetical protein
MDSPSQARLFKGSLCSTEGSPSCGFAKLLFWVPWYAAFLLASAFFEKTSKKKAQGSTKSKKRALSKNIKVKERKEESKKLSLLFSKSGLACLACLCCAFLFLALSKKARRKHKQAQTLQMGHPFFLLSSYFLGKHSTGSEARFAHFVRKCDQSTKGRWVLTTQATRGRQTKQKLYIKSYGGFLKD